ncbi:fructosamine kinase family protein [Thiosulfatimonas sediminis]|uniref:Fructosamine kinase family protein n=1 Tax=Thiosulfatimonas sediminis TaxID=2675054 RepID=A0A6F8PXZ5_9GAMM|nr:fructosamine kinase family protein [Thiosulfatimonas sediminis]BBP47005.1 fructosamine kinase family protein [Thiosulfatimonas sediminis]
MNWAAFEEKLAPSLGETLHIEGAKSVMGGDICKAFELHTSQGKFFLKTHSLSFYDLFQAEQFNLQALAETNSIAVPKAIASGTFDKQAWLLLEFIDMHDSGDDFQRGRDLALLHHHVNDSAKPFGWSHDNFIGLTPQHNTWHSDWIEFYREMRLKPQLRLAAQRGMANHVIEKAWQLIDKIEFWFRDYQPQASLLHGDLWGGNSAFSRDGDALIFDPACYYGDHETDIAMSELFGGFSAAFYAGYQDVFPLDHGYPQRKPLYNLYHLLNHYNLFGGHYQQQAESLIQTLLAQAK